LTKTEQDATIQRVNLASSITKEFVLKSELDDSLFDSALEYWKSSMDLLPITIEKPGQKKGETNGVKTANFVMEGGTVWALSLKKYRKIVTVNLCGLRNFTYTNIRIDLPGAYRLNHEDIKQSIQIIDDFRTRLETLIGHSKESNDA